MVQNWLVQKNVGLQQFCIQKKFGSKKIIKKYVGSRKKNMSSKICLVKKALNQTSFKLKKNLVQKNSESNNAWVCKNFVSNIFGSKNIFSQKKNDCNSSGISKSRAEYVQCPSCCVNVQSSLHENVVFSVCVRMDNAAYIKFIMWNSISGQTPGIISSLTSVVVWLSGKFLRSFSQSTR